MFHGFNVYIKLLNFKLGHRKLNCAIRNFDGKLPLSEPLLFSEGCVEIDIGCD